MVRFSCFDGVLVATDERNIEEFVSTISLLARCDRFGIATWPSCTDAALDMWSQRMNDIVFAAETSDDTLELVALARRGHLANLVHLQTY